MIMEVPEGLQFTVRLEKELTTSNVLAGDTWDGTLARDICLKDRIIWKTGTEVRGLVVQSVPVGTRIDGHGSLGIKVAVLGHDYVDTPTYFVAGEDKLVTRNARFVEAGAGYGALVAILSDGKLSGDHILGGVAIGAFLGSFISLLPNHRKQLNPVQGTPDEDRIKIPSKMAIVFRLASPVKVTSRP